MKKSKPWNFISATGISLRSSLRRLTVSALTAAVMIGTLTGCASAGASHLSAETTAAAVDMAPAGNTSYDTGESARPESAPVERSTEQGALSSTTPLQPVATSRKLIRNVHLNVETTAFDSLISSVSQSVTDLGGYLESSDISGASISGARESAQQRYAYLTARIPSSNLDGFVAEVGAQGNITNKSESTQDVTLQYSDVESRKKSLTIEQERLWALLEKADSVDAVIALESRLSEIRYQLESLESQLRTYDNQVDYSTVYLNVQEVRVFTPTSPDSVLTRMQKGFQRSLVHVGSGLVDFAVWFVSNIPALIVLAVIIAVVLLIVKLVSARNLRKRAKSTAAASQTPWSSEAPATPLCSGSPATRTDEERETDHTSDAQKPE